MEPAIVGAPTRKPSVMRMGPQGWNEKRREIGQLAIQNKCALPKPTSQSPYRLKRRRTRQRSDSPNFHTPIRTGAQAPNVGARPLGDSFRFADGRTRLTIDADLPKRLAEAGVNVIWQCSTLGKGSDSAMKLLPFE